MQKIYLYTMRTIYFALCLGFSSYSLEIQAKLLPQATPLPEFTHTDPRDWLGSKPLTKNDLKGKVVLIDIWTFECWNCYRSFPWLNGLQKKLTKSPLQIIGVHSPEFKREHDYAAIRMKMDEFQLKHPTMVDNDFSYWKALGNKYWPTFYIVDKQGQLRGRFIGEMHAGTPQAIKIEELIKQLLEESE